MEIYIYFAYIDLNGAARTGKGGREGPVVELGGWTGDLVGVRCCLSSMPKQEKEERLGSERSGGLLEREPSDDGGR
jgi:hypothetical protein